MHMTNEQKAVITKWINALRSGDYDQAKGTLQLMDRNGDTIGYCCLGVLATLEPEKMNHLDLEVHAYTDEWGEPTNIGPGGIYNNIREYFGSMADEDWDGEGYRMFVDRAIDMNDEGKTFDQIADYLEGVMNDAVLNT